MRKNSSLFILVISLILLTSCIPKNGVSKKKTVSEKGPSTDLTYDENRGVTSFAIPSSKFNSSSTATTMSISSGTDEIVPQGQLCIANKTYENQSCDIENAVPGAFRAIKCAKDGMKFFTSNCSFNCKPGFYAKQQKCLSLEKASCTIGEVRKCNVVDINATQTDQKCEEVGKYKGWTACYAVVCKSGYKLNKGFCQNNDDKFLGKQSFNLKIAELGMLENFKSIIGKMDNDGKVSIIQLMGNGNFKFSEDLAVGSYYAKVEDLNGRIIRPTKFFNVTNYSNEIELNYLDRSLGVQAVVTDRSQGNTYLYEWVSDGTLTGYDKKNWLQEDILNIGNSINKDIYSANQLSERYHIDIDNDPRWTGEFVQRLFKTAERVGKGFDANDSVEDVFESFEKKTGKRMLWSLTDQYIPNDVIIDNSVSSKVVITVSVHAFQYAIPLSGSVTMENDQKQMVKEYGNFFSRRLHSVLMRAMTDNGNNMEMLEAIFKTRYDIDLNVGSNGPGILLNTSGRVLYAKYEKCNRNNIEERLMVAANKDDKDAFQLSKGESFQDAFYTRADKYFMPEQAIGLLTAFEEMPDHFHKTPGLRYLLQRKLNNNHSVKMLQGLTVAWTKNTNLKMPYQYLNGCDDKDSKGNYYDGYSFGFNPNFLMNEKYSGDGYIEFSPFPNLDYFGTALKNKIIFIWANQLDDKKYGPNKNESLRNLWINEYWSKNSSGLFVSKTTLGSLGATPMDDFVESLYLYITNPNRLRTLPLEFTQSKYTFIKNNLMEGTRFFIVNREDLGLGVNVQDDLIYPGKIEKTKVEVKGELNQDKVVTITITLKDNTSNKVTCESTTGCTVTPGDDKAKSAIFKIYPPQRSGFDFKTIVLFPVSPNNRQEGHVLRGSVTIPKLWQSGNYTISNIDLKDAVDNWRSVKPSDVGMRILINNKYSTRVPPKITSQVSYEVKDIKAGDIEYVGFKDWSNNLRKEQLLITKFKVNGPNVAETSLGINWLLFQDREKFVLPETVSYKNSSISQNYILEKVDNQNALITIKRKIYDYFPGGINGEQYAQRHTEILDVTGQKVTYDYLQDLLPDDLFLLKNVLVKTARPDSKKPEINIEAGNLTVKSLGTNPLTGETDIAINISAKDDISGVHILYVWMQHKMTGQRYLFAVNDSELREKYPSSDPTVWRKYSAVGKLPALSGKWFMSDVGSCDRASNCNLLKLTEIVHFEVNTP